MSKQTYYLALTVDAFGDCDGAACPDRDDACSAAEERFDETVGGQGPRRTVYVAVTLSLPTAQDAGKVQIEDGDATVKIHAAEVTA